MKNKNGLWKGKRSPENYIIKACGVGGFDEVARMVEDRVCWRKLVKGATGDRTRPNCP